MLILLEVDSICQWKDAVQCRIQNFRYHMFILVWVYKKPLGFVCIVFVGLSVYYKS